MAFSTTQYTFTDQQIEDLKAEAVTANDQTRIDLCDSALGGSAGARQQVLAIINDRELEAFRALIVAAQGGNGTSRTQALAQLAL